MREQSFFHADHEDDGELQALCLMQRDERYGICPVLHAVHIGDEADALKERGEGLGSAEVQVVAGGRTELLNILKPFLAAFGLIR